MVPLVAAGCLQAVGVMAGIILGGTTSGGQSRPVKLRCRGRSGDARLHRRVDTDPVQAATARRVVDEVLAEHEQST
jgi:hypothetical protein